MIRAMALAMALAAAGRADLGEVKREPNLEKRAAKATDHAGKLVDAAREFWRSGDMQKATAALDELGDAVELAAESLAATGKRPSRSPKHFKRAELATRGLLRRLENLSQEFSVDDREVVERARGRVQKVHDDLLLGIMSGKR